MQRRPLALPPFLSDSELADVTISFRDSFDTVRLRHIMHEHGFAIVTDVLSAQECSELTVCSHAIHHLPKLNLNPCPHQASFTRDIAEVATADSSDLEVILRGRAIPGHFQRSFCTQLGLMHSELSWRCRQAAARIVMLDSHFLRMLGCTPTFAPPILHCIKATSL